MNLPLFSEKVLTLQAHMGYNVLRQVLQYAIWKPFIIQLSVLERGKGRLLPAFAKYLDVTSNKTDWRTVICLIKSYSYHRSLDLGQPSTDDYELRFWDEHSRKLTVAKLDVNEPQVICSATCICMGSSQRQEHNKGCCWKKIACLPHCVGPLYFHWSTVICFIKSWW